MFIFILSIRVYKCVLWQCLADGRGVNINGYIMDVFMRLSSASIIVIFTVVRYFKIALFFYERRKRLPVIRDDLLLCSASKLAERIRRKQVTSYEIVYAYIKRIKEVNPIINAVAEDRFNDALQDAKNVDKLISQEKYTYEELVTDLPLLGIPVTIKENLSLEGLSSTLCSNVRAGIKAKEDGDAVKLLKSAGAIPLLVSTTPEYCICLETYTKVFGITRNPYNTLRSCGGSSGGEGALLGAGASLIGLGSDLAGSIRFPSAFNGIFGHKPTHGLIPLKGHLPDCKDPSFLRCLTLGPMVRYAEDIPLVMSVLSNDTLVVENSKIDLSTVRIYYMEDCQKNFGVMNVQREIKRGIRSCAEHFRNKFNCDISDKKFADLGYAHEIVSHTSATMAFESPLQTEQGNYSALWQLLINTFNLSKFTEYIMVQQLVDKMTKLTPRSKLKRSSDRLDALKEEMSSELGKDGVFFFPAFPTTALRHKEFMFGYAGLCYAFIINILGFPSTTVPVGFDRKGMPIGIQVVANVNEDRLCMAVARELEIAFGGWKPPT